MKATISSKTVNVFTIAFLTALGSSLAFGYSPDPADYSTWMQMKANGLFAGAVWYDPEDEGKTAVVSVSDRYYYIPSGKALSSPDANATFTAAKLAIAGRLNDNKYNTTHTYPEITLLPGGSINQSANSVMQGGPIIVKGTSEAQNYISTQSYSNRDGWKNTMAIQGDSTAYLRYGNMNKNNGEDLTAGTRGTAKPYYGGYVRSNGSLANYYGTLDIRPYTYFVVPNTVSAMPGTLKIASHAIFENSKSSGMAMTLGGLELEDNSELLINVSGASYESYTVTDHLTITGNPKIFLYDLPRTNQIDIIKLTGAAAVNAPANVEDLRLSGSWGPLPRNLTFSIVDNGDGTKSVRMSWDYIKHMITGNNSTTSCFDNASHWHDGEIPGTDYDGDVYTKVAIYFSQYSNMQYPNMSITIGNGGSLHADSYGLTLKEINFTGTSNLDVCHNGSGQTHKVYTPIKLYNATLGITGNGSSARLGEIDSTISGTGSITVVANATSGAWTINGDTSGFTGDITYTAANGDVETRPTQCTTIKHVDPFGGDYAGSTAWKAVRFTNKPWIYVNANAGVTNVQRGTFISGKVNLEVEANKTMTLAGISTTYGGKLVKRGAGTLVLGSEAKFAAAGVQQTTPIADTNDLVIAAGALKVTDANAVNGLALDFAEGTKLVLSIDAEGDLATYGAKNVKWETPFATSAASGKIPVELDGTLGELEKSIAICTITDTAVTPEFEVPAKIGHRTVNAGWRDNGDGTKSYVATIQGRPGFIMIFR